MKKISGLLYTLILSLSLSDCVFDDLSNCPKEDGGILSLHLSYRSDTEGAGELPLKCADFYVFDARKRFVCSVTDKDGPFTAEREYRVPLPEGAYTVVSWANLHERLRVSPDPFIPGQTTFDEACLRLAGITQPAKADTRTTVSAIKEFPAIGGPDKYLYYGTASSIHVHTGQITRTVIPLRRDTKVINLSVRYNRADETLCYNPSYHPDACIRTADGILKFDNSLSPCTPFLLEYTQRDDDIPGGFDATFHKMTLRLDEPEEPQILLTAPGHPAEVIYKESLLKWLRGTGYDIQEKLDNTHEFFVELRFTCPHGEGDTHTTIRIFVNGWEYVPIDVGL